MIALSRPASPRRVAPMLYASLVAAARAPSFYQALRVADTIEGRYEMIVLHLVLLVRRLRGQGRAAAALSQALVDFMAADLDRSMREIGIGDLSVGRYMKRLGEGLYGRAAAYDAALDRSDAALLAEALLRNVYGGRDPGGAIPAQLAGHVLDQLAALEAQPLEALLAGRVTFPAIAGTAP